MNVVDSSGWIEYASDEENADFFERPITDHYLEKYPYHCLASLKEFIAAVLSAFPLLNELQEFVIGNDFHPK